MITYVHTYKRGVNNTSKDHQIKLANAKTEKDGKQKSINRMTRTNFFLINNNLEYSYRNT